MKIRTFPNRFVHSRESNRESAPYLMITLGGEDQQPPLAVSAVRGEARVAGNLELRLSWPTPADVGPAGVLGFLVTIDGRPLPREFTLVHQPAAKSGEKNNAAPGAESRSETAASAGPALQTITAAPWNKLGARHLTVVDIADTVAPVLKSPATNSSADFQFTPAQSASYAARNHL